MSEGGLQENILSKCRDSRNDGKPRAEARALNVARAEHTQADIPAILGLMPVHQSASEQGRCFERTQQLIAQTPTPGRTIPSAGPGWGGGREPPSRVAGSSGGGGRGVRAAAISAEAIDSDARRQVHL